MIVSVYMMNKFYREMFYHVSSRDFFVDYYYFIKPLTIIIAINQIRHTHTHF